MSKNELFRRDYDVESEMLLDFVQQALPGMAAVTSARLADSGDRIEFRTSVTLTSWGDKMLATVEPRAGGRSAVIVSGEPRVGILSTAWGEELHAAAIEGSSTPPSRHWSKQPERTRSCCSRPIIAGWRHSSPPSR